jgi:chromosomal replication initiation ATPase DnaA
MNTTSFENDWKTVLENIKQTVSKPSFETWLRDLKAEEKEENHLVITCPNEFSRDWVENRYGGMIFSHLLAVCKKEYTLAFVTKENPMIPHAPLSSLEHSSILQELLHEVKCLRQELKEIRNKK